MPTRLRRKVDDRWKLGSPRGDNLGRALAAAVLTLVLIVIALPIFTIVASALQTNSDALSHLSRNVLPRSMWQTLQLMIGVGLVAGILGTALAWVTTMYRFRGQSVVEVLIVLPMAMPVYIVAYAYVDWLDPSGPVQTWLRWFGGYTSPRQYWFPNVRSLWGATLLFGCVLYPYVYLAARASFVQQSVCVLEVARTLGRTPFGVFRSVALPLARPAIVAGVALVLMETLNDLGAVQHLGVETLSSAIAATWLQRNDLPGAALLSVVILVVIGLLLYVERAARSRRRFHHTTGRYRAIPFEEVHGGRAIAMIALLLVPSVIGFFIPFLILVSQAAHQLRNVIPSELWRAARNSIALAGSAGIITLIVGLVLVLILRSKGTNRLASLVARLAGVGYAIPGTVLALGLLFPLARFDNWLSDSLRGAIGYAPGLLLTGTTAALIIAFVVRFLTVAQSTIEAGYERLSPNLDAAARALGANRVETLRRVELPLLVPTLGAAALLVFVDAMKELPATLLLRPFGFDTLSTLIYAHAALEEPEKAAIGALLIVVVGLGPVLLLQRAMRRGRAA